MVEYKNSYCQWFSPGTPVSSDNITEILLKVALSTVTLTQFSFYTTYLPIKIKFLLDIPVCYSSDKEMCVTVY